MKKRIIVIEQKNSFDPYLENMDTKKVICRESGKTGIEAVGLLVTLHGDDFDLYEVIKVVSVME